MKLKKIFSVLFIITILIGLMPSISVFAENKETTLSADSTEKFFVSYHKGYTLLKSGRTKSFTEENRIISDKINVEKNCIYQFKNLSAKYGNCFYVIYDSNDEVINYLGTTEATTGEVIEEIRLIMPENASYFRIACDLNVNNKMFEASKSYVKLNEKTREPAIVSFSDDDCRSEVYTILYPLIKKLNLPYTLACPPDSLNDKAGKYLTTEQLKEIYASGVDVVTHHRKEHAMTEFENIDGYRADTIECLEKLKNMGIEVSGVAYPNALIKEDYMPVVKDYFTYGLGLDSAINTLPYESCYIHRCDIFPSSGRSNIDDAKALIDSVAENGGWLVFVTHCWYKNFSSDEIEELVNYIRSKNIEISNVTDVIKKYGNSIDIGIGKKPLTEMAEDYFIVDCMGRIYTNNTAMTNIVSNNMIITEKSHIKWEELSFGYNIAVTLLPSGKERDHYAELEQLSEEEQISQKKRNVSNKIYVTPNSTYKLANMSAKYGNCFYAIYDSDDNVISYQGTSETSTGETLDEITIEMPSNASYLKIACDLNVNNKMFKVYHANKKGNNDKNITFDANGGNCIVNSINTDAKIENLPVPKRDGYKFLGWYTGKTEGQQITTETIFEKSSKVYAHWKHSHKITLVPAKKATCKEIGNNAYYKCPECEKIFKDAEGMKETTIEQETLTKLSHVPKEVATSKVTKATLSIDGQINKIMESKCSICGEFVGEKRETITIPYPKTISFSKTAFTYNKKVQKPKVTIKGSDGKIIDSSNYTISYSNKKSKKIGEYKVTIKFKENYEGSKTLKYKIVPKGTSLSKVKAGEKKIKITWKAQKTETTGYEIQYSTNKNFKSGNKTAKITKNKTTLNLLKKLKAKKNYYIRIRTYKSKNGKKYYSSWSKTLKVKTK